MNRNRRFQKDTITRRKARQSQHEDRCSCRESVSFREAYFAYKAAKGARACFISEHILVRIGNILVNDIDQTIIDALSFGLKPHSAPSTRDRQVYTPISAVLKFASAHGWCAKLRLSRPKSPKHATTLPTKTERYRFVHACVPHLKRIVIFLLRTDATVAETLELDWADIDLVNKVAHCTGSDGRRRSIELDEKALGSLAQTPAALRRGRVFLTHRGKPYSRKKSGGGHLKSGLAVVAKRTGVKINVRILKRIRKERLAGERLVENIDATKVGIVAEPTDLDLTTTLEPESNGSK